MYFSFITRKEEYILTISILTIGNVKRLKCNKYNFLVFILSTYSLN